MPYFWMELRHQEKPGQHQTYWCCPSLLQDQYRHLLNTYHSYYSRQMVSTQIRDLEQNPMWNMYNKSCELEAAL